MAALSQPVAFLASPQVNVPSRAPHHAAPSASSNLRPSRYAANAEDSSAASSRVPAGLAGVAALLGFSAVSATQQRRLERNLRKGKPQLTSLNAGGGAAVAEAAKNELVVLENGLSERQDIRNIAIIAHVDHGKTTLTDALMKQCGMQKSTSMDNNQIEMERGITILAKNAAVNYKDVKINIVDTPGHADFGGEVERILNMADACLLLVDAQEGPMPQTKFVLRQALKLNRRVIVCINKVDKPASRCDWVLDTTFDLFASLGASDEICDFPVVYASGFNGVASTDGPDQLAEDLKPLLDLVLKETPKPQIDAAAPLQMLVSNLDYDDYIGRICIGRIQSGSIKVGQEVGFQYGEGGAVRNASVAKLWHFKNNEKEAIDEVFAGDICAFAGMDDVVIGDTVVDPADAKPLPPIVVEEPTVCMEFSLNKSPLVGAGKTECLTTTAIKARLEKECMTNLALRMEEGTGDSFRVKGRGTLQLGILMENMRREGFEIMVAAPEILVRNDPETGAKQEPFEEVVIEVPSDMQGAVLDEMNKKGAAMKGMETAAVETNLILSFDIASRNLIGMQGKLMQRCSGQAMMTSRFSHWGDIVGENTKTRESGAIIATADGKASTYSLINSQNRGKFFIEAGEEVYQGMVIGINNKDLQLELNICKEKAASNVRAQGQVSEKMTPKVQMQIDDWLGYMDIDELLEVTPDALRLCKKNSKSLKSK
eukprot:TRINITY_DN1768_c0_g1_i1.p1 TRINITY_DN1768_c0_g1~~TRINITY_DN1768_c0_g1_i1.p1  ORF type:complete len:738 (+),score=194.14 TRINITY_DN1768_c0_g1_i1:80-2215(+)